jgi:hypothetical protein
MIHPDKLPVDNSHAYTLVALLADVLSLLPTVITILIIGISFLFLAVTVAEGLVTVMVYTTKALVIWLKKISEKISRRY